MPFTIDTESLLIRGRRGDTASFTLNFEQEISQYTVSFFVKKNVGDEEAIIQKNYEKPQGRSLIINLTSEDTKKLFAQPNSYSTYNWGLKIGIGNEFVQTLIPQNFDSAPKMYIYPEVGGI